MTIAPIIWGSPSWLLPAALLVAAALGVLIHAYRRASRSGTVPLAAAGVKAAALLALGACLFEPLLHTRRARPGANLFLVVADTSESLGIRDRGEGRSRGDLLRDLLRPDAPWRARLERDFEVRRYLFDLRLHPVEDFGPLSFDGEGTALGSSLQALARAYRGRPVAGVLLFTDGIATDVGEAGIDGSKLPPIYPVPLGARTPVRDVALGRVAVTETVFESAPVTLEAEVRAQGCAGEELLVRVADEAGREIERKAGIPDDSGRLTVRFQLRPREAGIHFYAVRAGLRSEADDADPGAADPGAAGAGAAGAGAAGAGAGARAVMKTSEITLANNERLVAVPRTRGPYRVLYVSGRPNWELKFLRRALEDDDEVQLVGLIRIAAREPKFDYRSRAGESTNPLFRGFGKEGDEEAERYDEPVLLRIGTEDEEELRDGFPKTAAQLFRYQAVILDDVEAAFFTQDQMASLRSFVGRRGGGFLMLGGRESFAGGGYARTPVADLLPVYLDSLASPPRGAEYRLSLTREGWIQPWVRLRDTEDAERIRLEEMPAFRTLNPVRGIKPGAMVLAQARSPGADPYPALVAQPFGRGRAAALLIGDLWRWSLRRRSPQDEEPARGWRQMVRWLVADVPRRVALEVFPASSSSASGMESGTAAITVSGMASGMASGTSTRLAVRVRDEVHEPLDNASVTVEVTGPDGDPRSGESLRGGRPSGERADADAAVLTAEPSAEEAGLYEVTHAARRAGAYRARATVRGPDGSAVGTDEVGWTSQPAASEYRRLEPDRALLERLARDSGGEVVAPGRLESLVESLPRRTSPVSDPWVEPLWHRWWVLLLALFCLSGEWALRRWKGLP